MDAVRVDKWLWAARFYKTRALAAEAIDGGKVEVNGQRAKRARLIQRGDRVRLRLGPYEYQLTVRETLERRGPASVASTLYEEDQDSRAERQRLADAHRLAATSFAFGEGKPTKKQRRELDRLKRGRLRD